MYSGNILYFQCLFKLPRYKFARLNIKNIKVSYLLFFINFYSVVTSPVSAQNTWRGSNQCFEHFTTHGLSNSQVTCVLQNRQGFIWIGTTTGLNGFAINSGKSAILKKGKHDVTVDNKDYVPDFRETVFFNAIKAQYTDKDENGIWEKGTFKPAWWQTWWFKLFYVAWILCLVFFSTRYYFRQQLIKQRQEFEKMQAIENVRTKISRDIHDEIGAGLTKISLMSQRLKMNMENKKDTDPSMLQKITESSKEIINNLGEIIWTVNPAHDNLASLLSYLRNYTAHFFEDSNIHYIIDFPEEIPQVLIHPDFKRNLFLVIKESLNNVLKHAAATEVKVRFQCNGHQYLFKIADNGKGMQNINGRDFGNGFANMKSRMEAVNGKFEIASEVNNGTVITLAGNLFF